MLSLSFLLSGRKPIYDMTKQQLENLVKIGQLKREAATRAEFNGMVNSRAKAPGRRT